VIREAAGADHARRKRWSCF